MRTPAARADDTSSSSRPEQTQSASEDDGEEVGLSSDGDGVAASGADTPPWLVGVSPEDASQARALFAEGNALVKESVFVTAIEKYEEALALWDHPSIHYNLSLAMLNLEQPLRLREHLVAALKFEGRPLSEEKVRRARQYLNLVEKQLSHVVINCQHPGAVVKFDDGVVIEAPGTWDTYYLPGRHRLVASAPGYVKSERDLSLVPGDTRTVDLKLYTEQEWTKYKRKWSPLGPVVIAASGAAVAGAGGLLFFMGGRQVHREEDRILELCGESGCDADETKLKKSGERMQILGVAAMATGGAAALVGGVLMYINRRIPYRQDPSGDDLSWAPVASPQFSGLVGRGRF